MSRFIGIGMSLAVSLGLMSVSACRKRQGTDTKDAAMDAIKAALPPSLALLKIPSDQIEKYVPAADGSNGMPSTLNGLWWTDAKTVHFVASFKNVVWNSSTRTASLLFTGPGMYSQPAKADNVAAAPDFYGSYSGYDLVFTPDFKVTTLQPAAQDSNGNRKVEAASTKGYTMEFIEEGHWIRHTPNQPDYHLRRIVQADGKTRDPAYADYLKAMGPEMTVDVPAQILTDSAPDLTLDLPADATSGYVSISTARGLYAISVDSATPVNAEIYNNDSDWQLNKPIKAASGKTVLAYNISRIEPTKNLLAVRKEAGAAASVKLHITKMPTSNLGANYTETSLDFAGGTDALLTANMFDSKQPYTLTIESPTPLRIEGYRRGLSSVSNKDNGKNSVIVTLGDGLAMVVHSDQPVKQPLRVTVTPVATTGATVNTSSVVLAGYETLVSDRLATPYSVNIHNVTGLDYKTFAYISAKVSVLNSAGQTHCCMSVDHVQAVTTYDLLVSLGHTSNAPNGNYLTFNRAQEQIYVRYFGDVNVANPDLSYSLKMAPGQ